MTLIGMSLDGAKELLSAKGIKVVVKENTSDKMTKSDTILVTNAVFEDDTCYLTVSPFLIGVDK